MIKDQAQAHMVVYQEVDVFRIYPPLVVHPLLITAAQARRQDRLCVLPQINHGDTTLILRQYKHTLFVLFYPRRSRARRESRTRYFFQLMQSSGDSSWRKTCAQKGYFPLREIVQVQRYAARPGPRMDGDT